MKVAAAAVVKATVKVTARMTVKRTVATKITKTANPMRRLVSSFVCSDTKIGFTNKDKLKDKISFS